MPRLVSTPVKEMTTTTTQSQSQSQRSLHSPVPRSRLNSKEAAGATDSSHFNDSSSSPTPRRTRFNSRDLSRSYSGQYHSNGSDLLPLECLRSQQFLVSKVSLTVFLSSYLTLVLAIQFCAATLLLSMSSSASPNSATTTPLLLFSNKINSWTVTNAVHGIVTLAYVHWFKGSYLLDEQGELNAMTVWEQLEATTESGCYMRRTLLIVPTLLAYTACVTVQFEPYVSGLNVLIWSIAMLAKLPFMNGVRLFGINRTAGIDDDDNEHLDDSTSRTTYHTHSYDDVCGASKKVA